MHGLAAAVALANPTPLRERCDVAEPNATPTVGLPAMFGTAVTELRWGPMAALPGGGPAGGVGVMLGLAPGVVLKSGVVLPAPLAPALGPALVEAPPPVDTCWAAVGWAGLLQGPVAASTRSRAENLPMACADTGSLPCCFTVARSVGR